MARFRSWESYRRFGRAVRQSLRYVRSEESEAFLETVLVTSAMRRVTLKGQSMLWRAQLGHHWRTLRQDGMEFEVERAYARDRMKPPPDRAYEGRANPMGIPCLYLATTKETAMYEVRPWMGSYVSVGQFKTLKDLEIVDCSHDYGSRTIYFHDPTPEEAEKAVWSEIGRAFSEPVTRSDDAADYAPTQIIAELFKRAGIDGIAYRSNFGKSDHNIALFDVGTAELIGCGLYQVDVIEMKFSQKDQYSVDKHR